MGIRQSCRVFKRGFLNYINLFSVRVCVCVFVCVFAHKHMQQCADRGQRTAFRIQFSPLPCVSENKPYQVWQQASLTTEPSHLPEAAFWFYFFSLNIFLLFKILFKFKYILIMFCQSPTFFQILHTQL